MTLAKVGDAKIHEEQRRVRVEQASKKEEDSYLKWKEEHPLQVQKVAVIEAHPFQFEVWQRHPKLKFFIEIMIIMISAGFG